MAEGHAVARWGDALRGLVGERVTEIKAPKRWEDRAATLVGATVTDVRTHGKHLVFAFSIPMIIHAHALQYGSWQIGERGLVPRKAARFIRLRLVTEHHEALYFHGPVMEVLTAEEFANHERFASLGPDLLHTGFDIAAAALRVRAGGLRPVGDVVVDQQVVSGIGNIYKSEGLFLAGIHPRTPAGVVPRKQLREFFNKLIPLMQAGRVHYGATITLPEAMRTDRTARNWVYRRRGKPCLVCATPIEMFRQGELNRTTYACPQCQKERAGPSRAAMHVD